MKNARHSMDATQKIVICILCFYIHFSSAQERRNIVLIIVDDLRPALGCYHDKNAYTPNIDAFAEESLLFTRAYAQQALCAPSRNSLLTSRRPDTLYLYDFYSYWRVAAGNFTSLPQHLRQFGYTTASFGKVFHPGASSNWTDDSPYSWSEPPFHPSTERYKDAPVCHHPNSAANTGRRNIVCPVNPVMQPEGTLPDLEILDAATAFIKNVTNNKTPFFAAVGFQKPHIPLKFPRHYLTHHPLSNLSKPTPKERPPLLPTVAWNPWSDLRERDDVAALNISFPYGPMPGDFGQLIRQSYYAAVTYIDDLIGQLIKTLKKSKQWENTIVLLIGDHGWSLGEHGEWAKYSNFELALRVPFILRDPTLISRLKQQTTNSVPRYSQREESLVTDQLVELIDVFPTLCDLAHVPVPPKCDPTPPSSQILCSEGENLIPILLGRVQGKTASFSQYPRPGQFPQKHTDRPRLTEIRIMGYSMRTARHRYTEWVGFRDLSPNWNKVYGVELYDHHIDPEEALNLAGRPGLEHLQQLLSKQLRRGWRGAHDLNY